MNVCTLRVAVEERLARDVKVFDPVPVRRVKDSDGLALDVLDWVGVELADPVEVSLFVPLSEDVTVFVDVEVLVDVDVNVPVAEIRELRVKGVFVEVKVGFRVGDVVAVPVPVFVNARLLLRVGVAVGVLDWRADRVNEEDAVDVFVGGIVLVDVRVTS